MNRLIDKYATFASPEAKTIAAESHDFAQKMIACGKNADYTDAESNDALYNQFIGVMRANKGLTHELCWVQDNIPEARHVEFIGLILAFRDGKKFAGIKRTSEEISSMLSKVNNNQTGELYDMGIEDTLRWLCGENTLSHKD